MGPGLALIGALAALSTPAPAHCPAGVPVQAITVVNQAHVRPLALARVERALVAQSVQLRAAWGTPCVQFGPGGWPLYLMPNVMGYDVHYAPDGTGAGSFQDNTACSHRPDVSLPCMPVSKTDDWTTEASHELMETLADPGGQGLEVCDPVEDWTYRLRGIWVSDFVLPDGHAEAPTH